MPFTPPDWTPGDRIRKMRKVRNNMKQPDLARACGVTVDTVVQWENDRRTIPADQWRKLAEALGVPVEWLRGQPE